MLVTILFYQTQLRKKKLVPLVICNLGRVSRASPRQRALPAAADRSEMLRVATF